MSKQTSIEWLVEQMLKQGYFEGDKPLSITNLDHLQHEAKQMHRQEIVNAVDGYPLNKRHLNGEEYYEEIFGDDVEDVNWIDCYCGDADKCGCEPKQGGNNE